MMFRWRRSLFLRPRLLATAAFPRYRLREQAAAQPWTLCRGVGAPVAGMIRVRRNPLGRRHSAAVALRGLGKEVYLLDNNGEPHGWRRTVLTSSGSARASHFDADK